MSSSDRASIDAANARRYSRDVKLTVNGRPLELSDGSTIAQLLAHLKVPREAVAVEVNAEVIRRVRHAEHRLSSGDTVEVVTFVGGG